MPEIPDCVANLRALTFKDVRPGVQFAIIDWRIGTLARAVFTSERYLRTSCQEECAPEWYASVLPNVGQLISVPHIPMALEKIGVTETGAPSGTHRVTAVALANETHALRTIFGVLTLKQLMQELGVTTFVIGMPSSN